MRLLGRLAGKKGFARDSGRWPLNGKPFGVRAGNADRKRAIRVRPSLADRERFVRENTRCVRRKIEQKGVESLLIAWSRSAATSPPHCSHRVSVTRTKAAPIV